MTTNFYKLREGGSEREGESDLWLADTVSELNRLSSSIFFGAGSSSSIGRCSRGETPGG